MSQAMFYPERIKQLHKEKESKGLSCQQIVDIVLADGGITSLGTVKKIFSQDAPEKKFKDISLAPIEKALGIMKDAPTSTLPASTEEFYHSIIRELNQRLKDNERSTKAKDMAIVFLILMQFVWLIIDVATPDAGWYGSDASYVWILKLCVLLAFCVGFVLIRRKYNRE